MSDKQNIQEYSKETIRIRIRDMQDKPIANAKVTLLAMGQKAGQKIPLDTPTDSNGEVLFNSKPYLKDINRFEITIEHTDYYTYPKNRVRKLCRSYEYGHLCQESFENIPVFYYNGTTLAISPKINPFQKYSLKTQSLKSQAKQEYYIQLQENQKSLTIYKDRNLTQESAYTLCLDTTQTQQTGQTPTESKQARYIESNQSKQTQQAQYRESQEIQHTQSQEIKHIETKHIETKESKQIKQPHITHIESNQTQYTQQTQQTRQIRQAQDLQTQSQLSQSNTTLLNFDSKESLEQFTKDIQELIIKDKKKGNAKLVHRFVVGVNTPDLIAKALQYIEEFETRESSGVFSNEKLRKELLQIQEVIYNLNKSQRFEGWEEQVYKLQQYKNTIFRKQHIISLLKERIVNLVVTKRHTTNATLPIISNPTKSYYPDQGPTSLCGPAAFFYCLLVDRPDLYVKCVIDLWEKGEAQIKSLRIKPSENCKKPKSLMREVSNYINGVDWITLASLRDSENMILDYDEESDKVAGITLEGKIKQWFLKVGATILYSNVTYGFHINKDKLLRLVAYKQQYPQSHIISLINAGLLSKKETFFKFKSHWIVWKTIPQSNGKDIDSTTQNVDTIEQNVITWGYDNYEVPPRELQQYLSYNFGSLVILPIPYELG